MYSYLCSGSDHSGGSGDSDGRRDCDSFTLLRGDESSGCYCVRAVSYPSSQCHDTGEHHNMNDSVISYE